MRDPVLFQVVVFHPGIASVDELLAVIDEELGRLADDGPDETELARVAAGLAAGHWRSIEAVLDRTVTLASVEASHGRAELVGELPARLTAVSAEAVAAAAADLLQQHRAVLELEPESK
jgi:zinc protease